MFQVYQTSADILYLILTIAIALVALFLLVALGYLIKILRDTSIVSGKAKDTIDLVNHYLWQPIKLMMMVMEKTKEYAASATRKKRHKF